MGETGAEAKNPSAFGGRVLLGFFPLRTEKARPPNVLKESSAASRRITSATH
jgi:hypothetical protein